MDISYPYVAFVRLHISVCFVLTKKQSFMPALALIVSETVTMSKSESLLFAQDVGDPGVGIF